MGLRGPGRPSVVWPAVAAASRVASPTSRGEDDEDEDVSRPTCFSITPGRACKRGRGGALGGALCL